MKKVRKRFFFEKKKQKTFVSLLPVPPENPVMTWSGQGHQEQKFFAELFFKKATASLLAARKGVDARFRGHDGLGSATP